MHFKFLKSSAFKFTLLYVAIFAISATVVLAFAFQATIEDIEGEIKNIINSQIGRIRSEIIDNDKEGAVSAINEMMRDDIDRVSFFMLISPEWRVIAGNVETWPGGDTNEEKWITFVAKVQRESGTYWVPVIARTVSLPGRYLLMTGYSMFHLQRMKSGITRVLTFTLGVVLLIGALGGATLTYIVKRRIDKLNKVCGKIIHGNLSERVQVTGSGDEFDILAENFNAMMGRIADLVDGIRTVSHNIAHDLRTPLNRVRNRLERLLHNMPEEPEKIREHLRKITAEIDGLVATFNAILRISEAESGAGTELFAEFSLSETVRDVCDFYSLIAEEKGIKMKSEVADNITINGDKHLMAQAFANLLDNAIKYTPEGGEVNVWLGARGKGQGASNLEHLPDSAYSQTPNPYPLPLTPITLQVTDTGPGIPEEFTEKVKERFFRVDRSRSTKGSGLGLSLVNAVAKLHGGRFEIENLKPGLAVRLVI